MNKSSKGALAAAAAGILLLGGAGSLAYWTDAKTVDGTDINSGHLLLTDPECGIGWTLDGGAAYSTQILVPGDKLTKVCTFTLDAVGDHLTADFDVTGGGLTGDAALLEELSPSATYTVNAVPVGTSDVAVADGDTIGVSLEIDWPAGVEDNDSNQAGGLQATLADITVTATQGHTVP